MKDALLARFGDGKTTKSNGACNHHSGGCPVPIRPMSRDGDVSLGVADGVVCEGIVSYDSGSSRP